VGSNPTLSAKSSISPQNTGLLTGSLNLILKVDVSPLAFSPKSVF
jgi:hypothetical protein